MRSKIWAGLAMLAAIGSPSASHAAMVNLDFAGAGVTAALTLTYMPDPNASTSPLSSSPNTLDPAGSYIVSGIKGTFSDSNIGIVNAAVTGLVSLNRVDPEATNLLAPSRFSLLPILHGVNEGGITSPGFHYDNIFYPGGSPQTASDYPFSGGIFDIYGLAFTLDNKDYVNLWSNGDVPKVGLTYGAAVTDKIDPLDYANGVALTAIPLPASGALMGCGLIVLGASLRRRRRADA